MSPTRLHALAALAVVGTIACDNGENAAGGPVPCDAGPGATSGPAYCDYTQTSGPLLCQKVFECPADTNPSIASYQAMYNLDAGYPCAPVYEVNNYDPCDDPFAWGGCPDNQTFDPCAAAECLNQMGALNCDELGSWLAASEDAGTTSLAPACSSVCY
jgi:hypothetical protein